jgi:hypothetical protein
MGHLTIPTQAHKPHIDDFLSGFYKKMQPIAKKMASQIDDSKPSGIHFNQVGEPR